MNSLVLKKPHYSDLAVLSNSKPVLLSKVLLEEDYVKILNFIVEKNYFPDLPRLRMLKNYVECLSKGEEHEARTFLTQLRSLKAPTEIARQVGRKYLRSDNESVRSFLENDHEGRAFVTLLSGKECSIDLNMTLNQFFSRFISEDNAYHITQSFQAKINDPKVTSQTLAIASSSSVSNPSWQPLSIFSQTPAVKKNDVIAEVNLSHLTPVNQGISKWNDLQAAQMRKGKINTSNTRFTQEEENAQNFASEIKRMKRLRECPTEEKDRQEEDVAELMPGPDEMGEMGRDLLFSYGQVNCTFKDSDSAFEGRGFEVQEETERQKVARELTDAIEHRKRMRNEVRSQRSEMSGVGSRFLMTEGSELSRQVVDKGVKRSMEETKEKRVEVLMAKNRELMSAFMGKEPSKNGSKFLGNLVKKEMP
eukprot:GDKJ01000082.1.p1 GENE.GDKJ01000082.1~~GDKJ01000082.1.p1  ORF type:complete len:440 (+),score=78.32 GDKJ01000082.1:61-1320(+)